MDSLLLERILWEPYLVVTDVTGTVSFSDTSTSDAQFVLYRARILE